MSIKRVLERNGKKLTFVADGATLTQDGDKKSTEETASDREAAERLIELTRTKLQQGWSPTTKAEDVGKYVKALEDAGLSTWRYIVGLTDAEVKHFYDQVMRSKEPDITIEVLRRRPTRELFAWMLTRFDDFYEEDWTKAVKFLAKTPEQAAWINEELGRALEQGTLPTERAKKFAARNAKKIAAGPKPAPAAPRAVVGNEKDLLELIARTPADDAPRLVYADWLLEQGSGFGELIQLSCKLATIDYDDPRYQELLAKVEKLESKHAKEWLAPIRGFIRSWSFERGLLSRVVCDAALFTQAADAIALRAPRAYIELTGLKKKDVAALAKTPLGAFDTVNLDSQRIDDAGMAQIAASPSVAGVARWRLGYNAFGDAGLMAIAASEHFRSTEDLAFRNFSPPQFTSAGVAALLSSTHFEKLRELTISAGSFAGAFDRCTLKLESLELSAGQLTRADAEALVRQQALRGLHDLSINQGGQEPLALDEDDVNFLLDGLPSLTSFTTNIALSPKTQARIEALRKR